MRSWWLLLERACALGQLDGPRLGCLSPKKATEQVPEMDQPDSETFWSQCPPPPGAPPTFLCPEWTLPAASPSVRLGWWSVRAQPSFPFSASSLPSFPAPWRSALLHLQGKPGPAKPSPPRAPASPQPGHSPSPPWQAEAPEASITAKAFWKQVRESLNK